tara:strand:+ start:584 stop:1636 length:1053 start_codon:yes stop_codon:yes gene_type:complete
MLLVRATCITLFLAVPAYADGPLAVAAVVAQTRAENRIEVMVGEIVARETLSMSFPTGGRIATVDFEVGDKVASGAVLARIQSVQQEQALRGAQAGVATAQADYRQAAEDLDRQENLLERGATTRISRDTAEDALRIAQGRLSQAEADLNRANQAVEDTVLLAASDATVTARAIEVGQVVGAAQTVLELALGDRLDALFDVPEVMLTGDIPSSLVSMSLLDDDTVGFSGTVRRVSPLVDARTGTVKLTVGIDDPPDTVTYGAAVRGTAQRPEQPGVTLPYTAMTATADGPAVWIIDPETRQVALQGVTIARYETGRVTVSDGIDDGTLIVTQGAQLLYPGRVVTIVEATP